MIRLALERKISKVLVEYKDRLTRSGFSYLKTLFDAYGVEIIVVEGEDRTLQEELVEDLIATVTSFAARLYGRGSARTKKIIDTIREVSECR